MIAEHFQREIRKKYNLPDLEFNSKQWHEYSERIQDWKENTDNWIYNKPRKNYVLPYMRIIQSPFKNGFDFQINFSTRGYHSGHKLSDGEFISDQEIKQWCLDNVLKQYMFDTHGLSNGDLKARDEIIEDLANTFEQLSLF